MKFSYKQCKTVCQAFADTHGLTIEYQKYGSFAVTHAGTTIKGLKGWPGVYRYLAGYAKLHSWTIPYCSEYMQFSPTTVFMHKGAPGLTHGKVYIVTGIEESTLKIVNDEHVEKWYTRSLFGDVRDAI